MKIFTLLIYISPELDLGWLNMRIKINGEKNNEFVFYALYFSKCFLMYGIQFL